MTSLLPFLLDTGETAVDNNGEVFTRRWVVEALLDLTGYTPDKDLVALTLLEPACGSGAFLGPVVERLLRSASDFGRDAEQLMDAIIAFDLQEVHVEASRRLCFAILRDFGINEGLAAQLAKNWIRHHDFLLPMQDSLPSVDVVVGNPPYIRYDDLSAEKVQLYRQQWSTMRGRGDIYVGFIEASLKLLKPNGRLGFICADRWMRNQYGATLRKLVAEDYSVDHVWSMHDVDAFETEVAAYPAITVFSNTGQSEAVVAQASKEFDETAAQRLIQWSRSKASQEFTAETVQAHRLPHWFNGNELWPTGSPKRLALIEYLNDNFLPLHDPTGTGTKVAIGVATGADKVFITKDKSAVEEEHMLPFAMREDLATGNFSWQGNFLVNPWDSDGNLVDINKYPKMEAYLSKHSSVRNRFVARKNPRQWFRTIDKVHADIINKPKLLFPDMNMSIAPILEPGGHYPHHNLYYVTSETWDLEILGGLLMSRISQAFIEAYSVRMRGNTLRFQSQYLKKIRIPALESLSNDLRASLKHAFRTGDVELATNAATTAYGIDIEDLEID